MTNLNEKALEAAIGWHGVHVGDGITDAEKDVFAGFVRAYISALVPADAGELVEPLSMSMFVNADHMLKRLHSDRIKAATLIQHQAARIAELEAFVEKARDFGREAGDEDLYADADTLISKEQKG